MGMKKKPQATKTISNSRARFDYDLQQNIVAGIVLSGAETKSLRMGHGHLKGAFANIKDGELWLFNATITPMKTNAAHLDESKQTRARKLLVSKKQLDLLASAKEQGLTIVPVKILTKGRYIKVEIATAKGLKKYDKRQKIKSRDTGRDVARELKSYR
jgi:SsrA-binding protein